MSSFGLVVCQLLMVTKLLTKVLQGSAADDTCSLDTFFLAGK